ncbi:unnamed protein product [Thlaspi arvense]|uniref:Growth-regulating factor n=1 Tax=Thlaspi arvense TaxID=13288 RepID=A0AAU9S2D3_THLAR|nr:unnamed protein product [Thlaspi arvense]
MDPETKQKWYGSDLFLKQERSSSSSSGPAAEADLRSLKVAKTDEFFSASKAMLLQQQRSNSNGNGSGSLFPDGQHMLSFSSPYYHYPSSTSYAQNTEKDDMLKKRWVVIDHLGYTSGGLNSASLHGALTGMRGPFTPSQWMELEHQALIYKYINANIPIPSNLLFPIRKALDSAGFSAFSAATLRPSTCEFLSISLSHMLVYTVLVKSNLVYVSILGRCALIVGWGGFHLGFSSNADPEPGRCRRTDGKKWRCSRDAVADQKYCERHMNRGRHRSRKPVESHAGNSAASVAVKFSPIDSSSSSPSLAVAVGGGASNSLAELKSFQPQPHPSSSAHVNRIHEATEGLSILSPLSLKDSNPYNPPSRPDFGGVYSDSLLNPLQKPPSESHQPSHRCIEDNTQLSISIPTASDTLALSPLRLSRDLDPTQMELGLGFGSTITGQTRGRQTGYP